MPPGQKDVTPGKDSQKKRPETNDRIFTLRRRFFGLKAPPDGESPHWARKNHRCGQRLASRQRVAETKHPLGESNPCLRTENPMSWATRRRGRARRFP